MGTAVGFSTLLMCEYGPEKLQVTTIENYEKGFPLPEKILRKQDGAIRSLFWREKQDRSSGSWNLVLT